MTEQCALKSFGWLSQQPVHLYKIIHKPDAKNLHQPSVSPSLAVCVSPKAGIWALDKDASLWKVTGRNGLYQWRDLHISQKGGEK